MTRILPLALTLGIMGAAMAVAQTNAPGPPSLATAPSAPATAPPKPITGPAARAPSTIPPAASTNNAESKTAAAPVARANSFTEAEARSRLEAHGYTNVSGLQKDAQSIWRGMAMKNGQSVRVALDYQGNIVTQ